MALNGRFRGTVRVALVAAMLGVSVSAADAVSLRAPGSASIMQTSGASWGSVLWPVKWKLVQQRLRLYDAILSKRLGRPVSAFCRLVRC